MGGAWLRARSRRTDGVRLKWSVRPHPHAGQAGGSFGVQEDPPKILKTPKWGINFSLRFDVGTGPPPRAFLLSLSQRNRQPGPLCAYVAPITSYAAMGRLIPFNSNSPTGSTLTAFSTFVRTRGLIRICPGLASSHKREATLETVPIAA